MEQRARERLTGAAIVVALLVLLVPELLSGPQPRPAAPGADSAAAPLRSYTVDLDHSAASAPLAASAMPAPAPDSAPDAGAAPAGADAAMQAPASARASAPASVPAPPRPAAAPASPVPAAVHPATGRAAVPSGSAGSVRPAAAGEASARHARHPAQPGGRWSVQLGVFAERGHALALARRLKSAGFAPIVSASGRPGHLRYRVRVGSEYDHARARALQARLQAAGQRGEIVAQP
ncbi:MAG TPA: SPOR domain-containing protein [Steroidobacteraceae bacterium]|nr:SPOR domain-containing protein [Steroidobacteraceae bacterium]